MQSDKNTAQKKYLAEKRKQLRVWVENAKYEQFKQAVEKNGESIYGIVNRWIDLYIEENQ